MPFYNTSSVAAALGVSPKWLDNLLSHNKIDGVSQAKQGVARRLSIDAIAAIALIYRLSESASIPMAQALGLAERLLASPHHSITLGDAITLKLDVSELERSIIEGLAQAVEVTPLPARGRPLLPSSDR